MLTTECDFCQQNPLMVLKTGAFSRIVIPIRLHVLPKDGGHLIVTPIRHVQNRILLTESEAIEIWKLSIISAKALSMLLKVDWFNFQENGNWTVDDPSCHLHLHVYGRDRKSLNQPFGEALRFPLRAEIDGVDYGKYSNEMVDKLREFIENIEKMK